MEIHWVFNDCDAEKSRARAYWEKKLPRIERLLKRFRDDLCEMQLTLTRHANSDPWELRAILQLPTGTIVADERRAELEEAIDKVVDHLVENLRRHKQRVRKDYVYRRRRLNREAVSAAGPYLSRDVEANRRQAFFQLLQPLMPSVYDYARRALRILEIEGSVPHNELTARDLVDDVLVRAWDQYADRPPKMDLDVWLIGLLRERIAEIASDRVTVRLGEPAAEPSEEPLTPDEDVGEIDFWLERIFRSHEPVTLEDLVPDWEASDQLGELDEAAMQQCLETALARLPRDQREALLLHGIEGFEIGEIAMIQDRSEEAVEQAIQEARAALVEAFSQQVAG